MTEPPRRIVVDRQSRPVPPTDPRMNAKAQRVLDAAIDRYDAKQRRASAYDWLADHGLLAVVLLCVFLAGFVAGAIWQMNGH